MDQDLIIRNSKSSANNAYLNNAEDDLDLSSMRDDESESQSTSIHVSRDASLSIVRLIESSEGKYMLDFGLDNDPLVITSFSDNNHIKETSDDCKMFIEDASLKHLEVYAELAGVGSSIIKGEELDFQPSSALLHFEYYFHLLPHSVQQTVLHTLLPLEKLFSWSTLTTARDEGLLRWKDIRLILSEVKRIVPFIAPTSDGLLFRHIIQTHVTFHQFVSFAKIVEGCLQRLPDVKVKVYQSSTLSIDIQLTSDQNCTVCIGCLPSVEQSTPPSTQQLQDCPEDFVSWECVPLVAGESKIVRLEGLKHETVYDMYIHISRPSSEFPVKSTNADVVNSHFTVETQGFHLIDIFPVFESMTEEEQKTELLASTQDKSVRLKAEADGLIIPEGGGEEQNDYDNETWHLYIQWWKDRLGVRYDFCMRELMFASKNQEVRSCARRSGIVMSHGNSKDQSKREQWARAFGSWYHNHDQEPADANSHIQLSTDAIQCQVQTPVQTLNFLPRSEIDESMVGSLRPRFQNRTRKAEVKIDDADNDSFGRDALVLQSITAPEPKVYPSVGELCSTHNESTHVPVISSEPNSLEPTLDSSQMSPNDHHDETKATPHTQVSDTCKEELPIPRNKPSKSSSRLTIGVVGNVVGSYRHRFLRRLSSRIDTCLALTRPKTPSSLRGIALFRAKVRLVMLLQKVSNKPFSSLSDVDIFSYQQRDTRSAKSTPSTLINEEEEDDDDSVLMNQAKDHCDDRLTRNVFQAIRTWVQTVVEQRAREVAEKRAQEEKTLAAVQAFQSLLLRKCFRSFVEAVKATKECAEKDTIKEAEDEPSKNEVEYMCADEDDNCEFTSHWNTDRETLLRRMNPSSDSGALTDPVLLQHDTNRSRIKFLDDETLSSMRRAKRAGASNLYDVPTSLLRFDDPTEERAIHWSRKRDIVRGISPYA